MKNIRSGPRYIWGQKLGNSKSLDDFWEALFCHFLETVVNFDQKRPTQMGSKMEPLCDSTALWRGGGSVVSGGHQPPRRFQSSAKSTRFP